LSDDTDNPVILGIDPARTTSVAAFVDKYYNSGPSIVNWGSGPLKPYIPTPGVDQFREQLLHAIANSFGLPYADLYGDTRGVDYDGADMKRVKGMIWRAAAAQSQGKRGWHRKLKRAKRIQLEVSGLAVSASWWHMQLRAAIDFYRRARLREFQRRVFAEFFADAVNRKLVTMPRGWRSRFLRSRRPLRIINDEVDAFKQPLFEPSAPREVPPGIAHPEWYDEFGEMKDDDDGLPEVLQPSVVRDDSTHDDAPGPAGR
jgi:hypothetical protein